VTDIHCVLCATRAPAPLPAPHTYLHERECASTWMLEFCEKYGALRVLGALCARHRRMHEETRTLTGKGQAPS
jgi:hypothetical protein